MKRLSREKRNHIERLGDANGMFKIFAIDHRAVYAESFKQGAGYVPSADAITESKLEIIRAFNPYASSFLIDYDYCIPAALDPAILGCRGFMVGLEGDDYSTTEFKDNYLDPRLSPEKLEALGSDAVKLFLYYQTDAEISRRQELLIENIGEECDKCGIPFLLEPILIEREGNVESRVKAQLSMLKNLSRYKVDIFKLSFPGDIIALSDKENISICKSIGACISVPWIILSSGCSSKIFAEQLRIACLGGASGFAAGRTIWDEYLRNGGTGTMESMIDLFCDFGEVVKAYGRSWKDLFL